jgi:DNA processing protein
MSLPQAYAPGIEPLSETERFAWVRLARSDNIGPRTFFALIDRYGTAQKALAALPGLIQQGKPGRAINIASIADIEREFAAMEACGGCFIGLSEPDYPPLLRLIDAAPPVLAMRGDRKALARSKVAIIGSRNASAAGLAFTERLTRGIAGVGHVIVSGLARGIDARAHQASLETGTIAVLAGGLGRIYPADHAPLLERLLEHGAAISEMPFFWEARGRDFPRRNRIVSGLSQALVVVEAARRSGSLITARFAAEQGRQVFAVPGSPLDPRSEGTNDLLQEGASFCTKAEDVIEALLRQGLARQHEELAEAGWNNDSYVPLWDELELFDNESLVDNESLAIVDNESLAIKSPVRHQVDNPMESATELFLAPNDQVSKAPHTESEMEQAILELLGPTPVSIDELARIAKFPIRNVRMILMQLELAGQLEFHGNSLVSLLS